MMHRWLLGLSVALIAPAALPAWAQDAVQQIPYESVPNVLKMPAILPVGIYIAAEIPPATNRRGACRLLPAIPPRRRV